MEREQIARSFTFAGDELSSDSNPPAWFLPNEPRVAGSGEAGEKPNGHAGRVPAM